LRRPLSLQRPLQPGETICNSGSPTCQTPRRPKAMF
jgi:hypothetical protein